MNLWLKKWRGKSCTQKTTIKRWFAKNTLFPLKTSQVVRNTKTSTPGVVLLKASRSVDQSVVNELCMDWVCPVKARELMLVQMEEWPMDEWEGWWKTCWLPVCKSWLYVHYEFYTYFGMFVLLTQWVWNLAVAVANPISTMFCQFTTFLIPFNNNLIWADKWLIVKPSSFY